MKCIACAIAEGTLEGEVVLHSERTLAFLDHRPVFRGHVLVCPLPHADNFDVLSPDRLGPLFADVQRISAALEDALGCTGTFVAINNKVSQSVPHLHVHVVPRTKGDGLRGFFWPRVKYAEGELAAHGTLIREALARVAEPGQGQ